MSVKCKTLVFFLLVSLLAMLMMSGCGQDGNGGGESENGRTRNVGVQWEYIQDEHGDLLAYGGENVYVTDVCAGGPGLVAVGYRQGPDGETVASPCTLLIWTSEDGRAWSLLGSDAFAADADPLIAEEYSSEALSKPRITPGPAGLVITVGLHIFKSEDGLSWSEVSGVGSFENSQCTMNSASGRFTFAYRANSFIDVVGTQNAYVASVSADNTRPGMQGWLNGYSIWTSPDAENWSLVQAEYIELFGMDPVLSITEGGPGLVAVGNGVEEDYSANGSGARVWTGTPDGNSWSSVPDDPAVFGGPGDQSMRDVVDGGPGLVAVGLESSDIGGGEKYTGVTWTSTDGMNWERSTSGESAFADSELLGVTAGGPGLVAAGVVHNRNMESGSPASEILSAAVWTSTDGISWSRIFLPIEDDDPELNTGAVHTASFPGGLAVVGDTGLPGSKVKGAIWVSLSE